MPYALELEVSEKAYSELNRCIENIKVRCYFFYISYCMDR